MSAKKLDIDALDFEKSSGTVTVVAQDAATREVLMVAHADRDAIGKSLETGEMHYLSRSRGPWHKGATSGNVQRVVSMHSDCDGDVVLALVTPAGPACHTGARTCFGDVGGGDVFDDLDALVATRMEGSGDSTSYTRRLLADRNLRLKKLGEECAELTIACADGDAGRAAEEAADVIYHTIVALRAAGSGIADVRRILERRANR